MNPWEKPQEKLESKLLNPWEKPVEELVQPVQPMVPTLPKFETNEFNRDIPLMGRAKVIDETKPEIQFATDDVSETPLPSPAQTVVEVNRPKIDEPTQPEYGRDERPERKMPTQPEYGRHDTGEPILDLEQSIATLNEKNYNIEGIKKDLELPELKKIESKIELARNNSLVTKVQDDNLVNKYNTELEKIKASLDSMDKDNLATKKQVDDYNALVNEYNTKSDEFKTKIKTINSNSVIKQNEANALVNEYNTKSEEINSKNIPLIVEARRITSRLSEETDTGRELNKKEKKHLDRIYKDKNPVSLSAIAKGSLKSISEDAPQIVTTIAALLPTALNYGLPMAGAMQTIELWKELASSTQYSPEKSLEWWEKVYKEQGDGAGKEQASEWIEYYKKVSGLRNIAILGNKEQRTYAINKLDDLDKERLIMSGGKGTQYSEKDEYLKLEDKYKKDYKKQSEFAELTELYPESKIGYIGTKFATGLASIVATNKIITNAGYKMPSSIVFAMNSGFNDTPAVRKGELKQGEALGAIIQSGALGALFDVAGIGSNATFKYLADRGLPSHTPTIIGHLGSIFGGSYAIERATGSNKKDALLNASIMTGWGLFGEGKQFRNKNTYINSRIYQRWINGKLTWFDKMLKKSTITGEDTKVYELKPREGLRLFNKREKVTAGRYKFTPEEAELNKVLEDVLIDFGNKNIALNKFLRKGGTISIDSKVVKQLQDRNVWGNLKAMFGVKEFSRTIENPYGMNVTVNDNNSRISIPNFVLEKERLIIGETAKAPRIGEAKPFSDITPPIEPVLGKGIKSVSELNIGDKVEIEGKVYEYVKSPVEDVGEYFQEEGGLAFKKSWADKQLSEKGGILVTEETKETKVTEDKQKELKDEKETSKKRTRTEEKDTDLQKPTESKEGTEQALVEEEKPTKKKKVKKTVDKNPKNDSFSETQKYTLDGGKLEIAKRKGYDRFGVIELLVDKDSRRQGIATKLLQKAIDDHSRNLVSQVSNDASIDVHYKLGFRAYENGQSGRELSLGETKEARKEPSSIMMVSPKAQATTDGKPKPVDVVKEGKGKEVLTAEQLLKLPETERRLLDTTDDVEYLKNQYLSKTENYKDNVWYRGTGGSGEAGVGKGLYLGKDRSAIDNFYNLEGGDIELYEGSPNLLDLADYKVFDKFEKESIEKYPSMTKEEALRQNTIDQGYDGIRYYDPQATGEEFVIYNHVMVKKSVDTKKEAKATDDKGDIDERFKDTTRRDTAYRLQIEPDLTALKIGAKKLGINISQAQIVENPKITNEMHLANAIAEQISGKPIVWVKNLGSQSGSQHHGRIWADINDKDSPIKTTLHETIHQATRHNRKGMLKVYDVIIEEIIKEGHTEEEVLNAYRKMLYKEESIKEEVVAYYIGNKYNEEGFWNKLAEHSLQFVKDMIKEIKKLINDFKSIFKFEKKDIVTKMITSLEAQERIMSKAAEFIGEHFKVQEKKARTEEEIPYLMAKAYQDPFYSHLARIVIEKFPNKMKTIQVRNWLVKQQVKPVELDWSRVMEAVEEYSENKEITREMMLEAVQQQEPKLTETLLQRELSFQTLADYSELENKNLFEIKEIEDTGMTYVPYSELIDLFGEDDNNLPQTYFPIFRDQDGDLIGINNLKKALMRNGVSDDESDYMEQKMQQLRHIAQRMVSKTRHDTYQLKGEKKDYKELVISVEPQTLNGIAFGTAMERIKIDLENDVMSQLEYDETIKMLEKQYGIYWAPEEHFPGIANVVASIRFNTRMIDGKTVLFLEEVQSDWASDIRKKGLFATREDYLKIANSFYKFEAEMHKKYNVPHKDITEHMNKVETKEYSQLKNNLDSHSTGGVYSMPYIGTAWEILVAKRILRYAVENNFDSISWTTGKQQIDRWTDALRMAVDKIEWAKYEKAEDGSQKVSIKATKKGQSKFEYVLHPTKGISIVGHDDVTLSDAIGGKMAKQIFDSKETSGKFEGDNLSIGGRGFKDIYDERLGKHLEKLTKQLGGKVETTELKINKYSKEDYTIEKRGDIYVVLAPDGDFISLDTRKQAEKVISLMNDYTTSQQIFHITPEMRDPVMEGLPMFKRKEKNTDNGIKTKNLDSGMYPFVDAWGDSQTKDTSMQGIYINGKHAYNKNAPELDMVLEEISESDPYVFKQIEDQDGMFDTSEFLSRFSNDYDRIWNEQNQHRETEEESNILEQAQKYQELMEKLQDVKHGNIPKDFREFIKSVKLPSRSKASRLFGLLGNKNTSIPLFENIYEQWVKDGVTSIFEPYAGAFTLGTHALTKAINAGLKEYHANVFDKEKYMIIQAIKEGKAEEVGELLNKAIEQFTIAIYKESSKHPVVEQAFADFTKKYPESFVGSNDWLKFTLYDSNIGADAVNYPDVYEAFREVFQTVMNEFAIDRTDIKSLDDAVKIAFSNVIGIFSGKGQSMISSNGFKSFENVVYHPKYGMIAAINQTAEMMKLAKEKGTEINIYTEDGADFINRIDGYDNANTGIYLDPPYIKSALSTYKDQSIEDKDLLNKFMIPEEFINTHKKALLAARDEGARIALTNDSNYAYMKALQDELGDPSIFIYKEGSTPTSLITDKATAPISQEYFDKVKTQTTAGTTAVIEDPEVTAEKTRIRRLIHITAKMRGIVQPDKKTSAALERIIKKITGHNNMSGKNNKLDISIEQYKKILKAVKVKRPPKSGGKIVIMETTERRIQELKSHMISKGKMTQKHFKDIVKAVTGNDTFFEPRWIHRHKFVTNAHGRQIIKGMIDASNTIAREIKINEALKNNSVIDDKIKKSIRILSKKYANEELNDATSEQEKPPNVTSWTKKFMDVRYLTNLMEKVTGLPFGRVHMELINARHEADKMIHKIIGDMHADIPMVIFKDIVNSEASLMRIEKEVASKMPKYMDRVPEADPNITEYEKQIADYITEILQKMEADVRFLRFMEFYNQHYQELYPKSKKAKKISNQSLNLLKKVLIPNAPNEAINEAVNILETKGIDALRIWLDKQTWGVIATGYDIGEAASKTFSKKSVKEAMSKTITKGHLKARQTVEYQDKEINIIQRFSSYVRQMVYNTELISELNTWSNMLVANIDKFDNSKYLMKGLYDNIEQIHGRGPHPERWFENFIVNAYSQASRAIFLDLEKPFRNSLQNIAMHRGIVKDSIGMRKLTKADREFYDTHVTQLKAIALDQLYRQYKGWGKLPGIKQLNIISDKANTIGRSDDFNRMWDFRMVMGRIYKAIKKHPQYMNTTTELNAMLKASGYGDITSIERIHGLQILATDGELAFSHYLTAQIVKKDHFQYERHLRSIEEQGSLTRELASNLFTFPKGYIQRQFLDIAKLTKIERELGKDIDAPKTAAQAILWSAFIGAMIASSIFRFITGDDREPYSVQNIALRMSIGGIALSAYNDAISFGSDIVNASAGDPWALKRLEKAPLFFNEFIPMYKILIDMLEAVTGTKRIDFLGTRQILGGAKGITIIDVIFYTKENDKYLTKEQIKMIKKYRIKRGFWGATQHFLFGNNPPTIADRIDEAVKDIEKHGMNRWEKLYWKAETKTAVDLDYIDRDKRDKLIRKLERANDKYENE